MRKERERVGCDGCNKETSTECFDGYIGGKLWLCGLCYSKLTSEVGFIELKKLKQ